MPLSDINASWCGVLVRALPWRKRHGQGPDEPTPRLAERRYWITRRPISSEVYRERKVGQGANSVLGKVFASLHRAYTAADVPRKTLEQVAGGRRDRDACDLRRALGAARNDRRRPRA